MRRYRFLDKNRKEIIASLISDALDIAIRETGKRQWQIAETIGVSENSLTRWRKGWSIPRDRDFEKLLEFLGRLDPPIGEDFFSGAFKDEPYIEDPDYVSAMSEDLRQYANHIGLSLDLMRFMISTESFEEIYPQWTPIVLESKKHPDDSGIDLKHFRPSVPKSKVAKKAKEFRIGNRVLNEIDLHVFRDFQDYVVKTLRLWAVSRMITMNSEVEMADEVRNRKVKEALKKGDDGQSDIHDIALTVGELGAIDPYFRIWSQPFPEDMLITNIYTYRKEEDEKENNRDD